MGDLITFRKQAPIKPRPLPFPADRIALHERLMQKARTAPTEGARRFLQRKAWHALYPSEAMQNARPLPFDPRPLPEDNLFHGFTASWLFSALVLINLGWAVS